MKTLENNGRHKTLENLEKDAWLNFNSDSQLTKRIKELRNVQVGTFTTEDLRIMIGQQISLDFLVPLALETLDKNLFAEGDFYEGDLLKAVLTIETDFWNKNKDLCSILYNLIKNKRDEIAEMKFHTINIHNCCNLFQPGFVRYLRKFFTSAGTLDSAITIV